MLLKQLPGPSEISWSWHVIYGDRGSKCHQDNKYDDLITWRKGASSDSAIVAAIIADPAIAAIPVMSLWLLAWSWCGCAWWQCLWSQLLRLYLCWSWSWFCDDDRDDGHEVHDKDDDDHLDHDKDNDNDPAIAAIPVIIMRSMVYITIMMMMSMMKNSWLWWQKHNALLITIFSKNIGKPKSSFSHFLQCL